MSPELVSSSIIKLVELLKDSLKKSLLTFRIHYLLFLITFCDLLLQPRLLLSYLLICVSVLHMLNLGIQKLGFLLLKLFRKVESRLLER